MDISAIDKIANRRRLLEDADKIQEKISKENKEIIKLQIAQDSAFWEQKQKIADVKGEHERLQQNMLQLQMQYEELLSKYQEELRTRTELLNKLDYSRKLCDELETVARQCMEQAARAERDRAALRALYAAADRAVSGLQQQAQAGAGQAKRRVEELLQKLKEKSEHQEQLAEKYRESQLQLHTLRGQLEEARAARELFSASAEDVKRKLEAANVELQQREATITNLQREMRNMATNIHSQLAEAKNILMKKDNDLKSAAEEMESLKRALSNQEEFTKMQCERNDEMLEKLTLVEEQHQRAEASTDEYKKKLEEMTSTCENFKSNMAMFKEENEALTRELDSKQQLLNLYTEELESYKQRLLDYDFKLDKITLELNKTTEESENKKKIIDKLETEIQTLTKTLSETQNGFENYREEAEGKLKSLAETIEEKCHEIEFHSSASKQANEQLQSEKEECAKLVAELQVQTSALTEEKEARAKIESDLVNLKREFEIEVETLKEQLEKNVSLLEAGMRAKEEEHSRALADSFKRRTELEKEKNTLQEVIEGLEQRIINIMDTVTKTHAELSRLGLASADDAVDEWLLSARQEPDRAQGGETGEDAVMVLPSFNLQDSLFNFSETSRDSLRLRPQPATEKRNFAWAAEVHSDRQLASPMAAARASQRAPHTAVQPQSQAGQSNPSRANVQIPTKMARRARPDTPVTGRAAKQSDAAAAIGVAAGSKPTKERRFFKTPRDRSKTYK